MISPLAFQFVEDLLAHLHFLVLVLRRLVDYCALQRPSRHNAAAVVHKITFRSSSNVFMVDSLRAALVVATYCRSSIHSVPRMHVSTVAWSTTSSTSSASEQ